MSGAGSNLDIYSLLIINYVMLKIRIIAFMLLLAGAGVGWFAYSSELAQDGQYKFKLGLDLSGGTQLLYKANTEELPEADRKSTMSALRDTIERRVNVFGVAEPLVQTQKGGGQDRLIVELPGVTDTQEAIDMLGKTPVLEFKLAREVEADDGTNVTLWESTGLTGKYLKRSTVQFGSGQGGLQEPVVSLQFNKEGSELFANITKENKGEILGIFLDGYPISTPVINEEIPNGEAIVSGSFTTDDARELVRNLNYGALPVGIELLSAQTVGASLGAEAVERGVVAGVWGLAFVALFLILWYRLPGVIATVSLATYIAIMLAIFKLLPVTLTAAGIAGFILSIGLAVDANVLIFERLKEELREQGAWTHNAMRSAFKRAWLSIRDGNLSSIITAIILFWFGTSLVKGFALVFGIGVIISMLTAITVTRLFLLAIGDYENKGWVKKLFGNGLKN
jgi:protein-export membrane protein SecD